MDLTAAIEVFLTRLNEIEKRKHAKGFKDGVPTFPADNWYAVERNKFIALNCRDSGAFMVEKATGELFNIKGYGRPDYNKKQKADLGNVLTADPETVHARRWNYLR